MGKEPQMEKIPVGYSALIKLYNLSVIPPYRLSYIALEGRGQIYGQDHQETHIYPKNYAVKNAKNPFHHLAFALKYDGVNLEILQAIFEKLDKQEIEKVFKAQPTSKYTRILWFLYEFLTEKELSIPKITRLKYVDVLDPDCYFTSPGIRSQRHRVNNNLIGNKDFCPIIRRTKVLEEHIHNDYDLQAKKLTQKYNANIIARASHYLYTKETLSSFEIEHEKPSKDRASRFVGVLQKAPTIVKLTKEQLIELQNIIVDPRFKDSDFRTSQNYVGENVDYYFQKIHYISPKPENVESLMNGLLETLENSKKSNCHPVLLAAAIAFGFVFIHPFEDGNGRLHRFLIHYILSKEQFTPPGIIFPVSAVMFKKIHEYDRILETLSKPLMSLISEHELSEEGVLSVQQPTHCYYKFIDYTRFAEYLFLCIKETLHEHFEKEMQFIFKYDKTKSAMQAEVDMPDKLIDLFIKFSLQNKGKVSSQKKDKFFQNLSEEEINNLESIINTHMQEFITEMLLHYNF